MFVRIPASKSLSVNPKRFVWLACKVLLPLSVTLSASAQNYWNVHTFSGNDGWRVESIVLSGGTFYGVTSSGSAFDYGGVFSVNLDGSNYRLLKFSDQENYLVTPRAGGIVLKGSTLYGVTQADTLYRINTDGTGFSVLKTFNYTNISEAGGPSGGLVLGGSKLYGVLRGNDGNTISYAGGVYSINTDGTGYTLVKSLNGTGAATPICTLVLCGSELFGTTEYGGYYGEGTVFKVNTNGTGFAVLVSFYSRAATNNAASPYSGLGLGGSTLYGVTAYGGAYGYGALYRVNTDGTGFAVLKNFAGFSDGRYPYTPPIVDGTVLYGEAATDLLFRMNTDGSGYTVLVTNCSPLCFLMSGSTVYGGAANSIFGLAPTSGPPVIVAGPASQKAAQGDSVSLEVHAAGALPLSYQWFFNQSQLATATNAVLESAEVQPAQAGSYTVVITNVLGAATSAPAMLTVAPASSLPVTDLTDAGLRAAMASGNPVTFGVDGLLTLPGPLHITRDTMLDGSGHHVLLSGGYACPLLIVDTNVTLTLANLALAGGVATNGGGAIWNRGGTVNLVGVSIVTNFAYSFGGGIYNQGGRINATNCTFSGNLAEGFGLSTAGLGGGLESEGANALVNLHGCVFTGNAALSGGYTVSRGGAVFNSGTLLAGDCSFLQNSASGIRNGSDAQGGALANAGALVLAGCLFASNSVTGGQGAQGSSGYGYPGAWVPGGTGGRGSNACGAALANEGVATAINCSFAWNQSFGGVGGAGGLGGTYRGNTGPGGDGGSGGNGCGAVYSTNAQLSLINCTLASNASVAGPGGPGVHAGTNGTATGSVTTAGGSLVNTLLAGGAPRNFDGSMSDLGHNLSSDSSCAFTNTGSLNSTDPKLGSLADNGGPTLTLALLPDSPAIDAADPAAAPVLDQRGFPRPAGAAPDIGAYEYGSVMLTLTISRSSGTTLNIVGHGNTNQFCRLLVSADLLNWSAFATNQIGSDGTASFQDDSNVEASRFYRLVMP